MRCVSGVPGPFSWDTGNPRWRYAPRGSCCCKATLTHQNRKNDINSVMNPLQSRTTYEFSFTWPGEKTRLKIAIPGILSAETSNEGVNCNSSLLGTLNARSFQYIPGRQPTEI